MLFFLIGFMGSGKSHWGKLWAAEYKLGFIDMDEEIEIRERKSVSEIFDSKGEDYFRSVEAGLLRTYEEIGSSIIACGGGTPCFHNNLKWMNEHGLTIYLSATPEQILRLSLIHI
jgi:shikimate kinase